MASTGNSEGDRQAASPEVTRKLKAFWDARYADEEFAYGTAPNDFLVQMIDRIAPQGHVLCLADGEGRNGAWLAQQGRRVTSVDVSERGMQKARDLARRAGVTIDTATCDVTHYALGVAAWDAIVSIFLHLPPKPRRALHARCAAALKPGGTFIYEAYGHEQLRYGTGGPKEPELLPTLEDVLADLTGLRIEHRFAGTRAVHEGRLHHGVGYVVQIVARREAA
ncbi:MAG: SAM-dependent methyltransferase [Gemmatimonadota bacterium]